MNNFSCKLKIQSDSFLPLQLSFDLSSLDIGQGHQKWCVYVKLDKGYHHLNFERSGFDTKLNKKTVQIYATDGWLAVLTPISAVTCKISTRVKNCTRLINY